MPPATERMPAFKWPDMPTDLLEPFEAIHHALGRLLRRPPLMARSRKVFPTVDVPARFLWTFPRDWLPEPDSPDLLVRIFGTPLHPEVAQHWSAAPLIHIGLEGAASGDGPDVRKVYLEFEPHSAPVADLAYLAMKCTERGYLHRYERVTDISPILDVLALPERARVIAALLARRSDTNLRVSEDGTPRLSLDISLADIAPDENLFAALARLVTVINPNARPPTIWPSHVALGRDRTGNAFVTLYGWPSGPSP